MGEYIAVVRVLKDVNLALVERDVCLKKEDVITLPLKVGAILSKHGYAEIISIEYYEKEEIIHDMGKCGKLDMAKVEG
ncbi:hypothetical protein J7L85_00270 [candidate division WOR-3 bacterium]|nr:hypothetical protein [candidate division WOR-3 bacterium]